MKEVIKKVEIIIRKIINRYGYESLVISPDGYYLIIDEKDSHFFKSLDELIRSFSDVINEELTFLEKPFLPFVASYIEGVKSALSCDEAIQVGCEDVKMYKGKDVEEFADLVSLFNFVEDKREAMELPEP